MEEITSFVQFFSFNNLKKKHIEKIIMHSSILLIQDGACLYEHSTNVNEVYCLISGNLKIKISSAATKDENMASKLMNEYHLTKEPTVILNQDISLKPNEIHSPNLLNQNSNNLKSRRRKSFLYNLKSRIIRNSSSSLKPSIIKSSIYDTTTPIVLNYNNENEIDALTIDDSTVICDWNIIHNLPHYSSAYSQGQCLLLCLDKEWFSRTIERPLRYSFEEKKTFIANRIKALGELSIRQFDVLYHQFIWIYPKYNDKLITENKPLTYFYIIYKGQCSIQPNDYNKKLLHFSAGDFLGLEALFNPKANSPFIITSSSYDTILIRFDIELFNPILIKDIKEELMHYYNTKRQILHNIINSINTFNQKIQLNYKNISKPIIINTNQPQPQLQSQFQLQRQTFLTCQTSLNDNNTDDMPYNGQDIVNIIVKKKLSKNKVRINQQTKEFSLQRKSAESTIINQFNTTNTYTNTYTYANTLSNVNTEPMTERSTMENKKTSKIYNIKSQGKLTKSVKNIPDICNSNNNYRKTLLAISHNSANQSPVKQKCYYSTGVSFKGKKIKNKACSSKQFHSLSPVRISKTDNGKYSSFEMKFIQTRLQRKQPRPLTIIEKLHKTICDWSRTLNDPRKEFMTRSFKMPLLSLTQLPH